MPARTPVCYTTLKPFAELFGGGLPVLMYHKLGPRPSKTRIKGLYVSESLFERQLAELRRTGHSTPPFGAAVSMNAAGKPIALSFDDGFENVLRHGIEPLARNGFHAIQFLIAGCLGGRNEWEIAEGEAPEPLMDESQVRDWLSAGHEIGSHTLSHPRLSRITLSQAREEIAASKKRLEDTFSIPIRHFCYPWGDWNEPIRDLVLSAGYETASTTAFGVNAPSTPRLELKRIMARHQSLSFKSLRARLFSRC